MRISERGQVTIPQLYREQYGYLPNTEVVFEVRDGVLVLRRASGSGQTELGALFGKKKLSRSTDEIMALLRDE